MSCISVEAPKSQTMNSNWRGALYRRRRAMGESGDLTDTDFENHRPGERGRERNGLLTRQQEASVLDTRPPSAAGYCNNYCCTDRSSPHQGNRKPSRPHYLLSCRTELPYRSPSYRERLEIKVLNDELLEQEIAEKEMSSRQTMDDVTEILRTVSVFAHALELRHKVSQRLLALVERLSPSGQLYRPPKEAISWTSVNKKLSELVMSAGEHSELPESYVEALEDYRDKAKDYAKATANFCKILQSGSAVSNTQLRKLELQYDEIRAAYLSNKSALNSYLGDMLDSRISTTEKCLQGLVLVLSMTVDADQEMGSVLKDLPPTREMLHHHSGSPRHRNDRNNRPLSPCRTAPSNNSLLHRLRKRATDENKEPTEGRGYERKK